MLFTTTPLFGYLGAHIYNGMLAFKSVLNVLKLVLQGNSKTY